MADIPYTPVLAITLAAVASYLPRALGAFLSGRIAASSGVIEWITCVTYALMAGLVARMILMPIGSLAATPDWMRTAAAAIALAAFLAFRKSIGWGVFAGAGALTAMATFLNGT
ncbi:MAG: AzlD domain-containing protein [Alphaproteobacteria bacterium]|nr:AzlD domain-containing protein [Alphaproteobacteria bacterium]